MELGPVHLVVRVSSRHGLVESVQCRLNGFVPIHGDVCGFLSGGCQKTAVLRQGLSRSKWLNDFSVRYSRYPSRCR